LARDAVTRPHQPLLGIVLIVSSAACFGTMDTTLRYLGAFIGIALMLWLRFAMHALAMTAWIAASPDKTFRTANPRFQFFRGSLLLFSSAMAFNALRHMPVAEFTAIVMITPLLITLLARVWLKERVSALRWVLVAGGLAGTLIIIRPGSGLFGWAVLLPLAAALSNAFFQLLTSRLAPHENPFTTNFYTGLTGMLLATPLLIASSQDISDTLSAAPPLHLGLLLMIGVLGTGGHLLLIMALGKAPTATLMPFLYTQIAVAAFLGWLALGAVPDGWSWIGMAVIAVCGAVSAWLNMRDAASNQRPVSAVAADTVAD
jgi:drug/metabolite transporter (DMT)-like permease